MSTGTQPGGSFQLEQVTGTVLDRVSAGMEPAKRAAQAGSDSCGAHADAERRSPGPAAAALLLPLFGKKKARLPVRPQCAFQLLCISSVLNSFKESTERNGLQCFKKS